MEYSLCSIQKKDHSLFSFLTPHLRIVLLSIMMMAGLPAALHADANDDYYTTTVDQPVTGNVLDNDTGEEKEVVSSTDPSHGTLSGVYADGSFTYTPAPGYSGNDSFQYTMGYCTFYFRGRCYSWEFDTADVIIEISSSGNQDPVAEDDAATTYQNRSVTINVLNNDSDPDGDTLQVTGTSNGPSHGSVTINDDNTITYTPATDYVGEDRFDYTISDGHGGTAGATVTITVNELEIVENADDLCYEDMYSGCDSGVPVCLCLNIGPCEGGIGCIKGYPLKNIGDSTLTDVRTFYNETGLGGSFGSSCGVDDDPSDGRTGTGGGTCGTTHDIDFGPIGFLGSATEYNLSNSISPNDDNNSIWVKNFIDGSCFNGSNLYGEYIKDGKLYRGQLKKCSPGYTCANPKEFSIAATYNTTGNIILLGNTNICMPRNNDPSTGECVDPGDTANNNINAIWRDGDNNPDTNSSSAAKLELPPGATVLWAGIYWQGYFSLSNYEDLQAAQKRSDKVKLGFTETLDEQNPPYVSYEEITAERLNHVYFSSSRWYYQGFKTITSFVSEHGSGWYWGADIATTLGKPIGGTLGAWSIAVIYRDENDTIKNLTIFDGYLALSNQTDEDNAVQYAQDHGCDTTKTGVSHQPTEMKLEGFLTPKSGPVHSRLLFFAGEGDISLTGDNLWLMDKNQDYHQILNATNPENNIANSSITDYGVRRNSSTLYPYWGYNTIGIDIDTFDASQIIQNNQTSTQAKMDTVGDGYFPGVFGFSTELYRPKLCYDYTYGQNGTYITVTDLTRFMIEGDFDSSTPLDLKFYIQNTENSDVTLDNVQFNLKDINTSYAAYRPETTYRKVGKDAREYVPDSGRETNATDDRDIPIGSVGGMEYFYTYLELDINSNHPTPFALPIHADIDYDLVVDFEGERYYLGHQTTKLSEMDPCRPSPVYQPTYGAFNVVHRGMDRSDDPYYYYNLPTQVVQRNGNFLIESMDPSSLDQSKEITTIVGTELLDISGFHLTNANCLDPNATVASDKRVWTILDDDYKAPISQQEMKDANFFNRAVRNAAFRINYLTTQDGQLVTLRKNGDLYIIDSFSNIRNSDSCSETCTDQISTTGVTASTLKACAECLYTHSNSEPLCSRDNFSIRPESYRVTLYDLNQSDFNQTLLIQDNTPAASNLNLVAGYTYRLDINATDHHNGLATPGYYTPDVNGSLTWSPNGHIVTDCNDENNITQNTRFKNGVSDPFYLQMPNVGRYTLEYRDTQWTEVDSNATLMQHHLTAYFKQIKDCLINSTAVQSDATYQALNGCDISSIHYNGESGYQKEYTDMNLSFYPYRFTISPISSQDGKRIYINTPSPYDKNMSFNINTIFRAVDYRGNTLSNFVHNCYADDINMSLTLTYLAGEPNATIDREPYLSYDLIDINDVTQTPIFYNDPDYVADPSDVNYHLDLSTPSATFAKKGSPNDPLIITDQNASNFVKDMNGSIRIDLGLNYVHHYNTPLNPRKIHFYDFNITYYNNPSTLYADMSNDHKIVGSLPLNDTVTFVYGRVVPSLDFYNDITDLSVTTPISVVIYCDESDCTQYGINPSTDRSNEFGWYLNTQHHDGTDGNVYLSVRSVNGGSLNDASVTPAYTPINPTPLTFNGGVSNAIDENVEVRRRDGAPLPLNVQIQLDSHTDPWFVFNTAGYDNNNTPELFDVQFSGPSGWTGYGKTGNVVESNASRHRSRRLEW